MDRIHFVAVLDADEISARVAAGTDEHVLGAVCSSFQAGDWFTVPPGMIDDPSLSCHGALGWDNKFRRNVVVSEGERDSHGLEEVAVFGGEA